MVGLNTTLTYYTNSWFAVEGNVITGFGSDVFGSDTRAKIFGGAGGIRIGGRRARWEPFGHALVGGSALTTANGVWQQKFADGASGWGRGLSIAFAAVAARGSRLGLHHVLQPESQNNFQLVAGVVLHF